MEKYNHFSYGESLSRSLRFLQPGIQRNRKVLFTAPNSDTLYSISQKLSEINYPVLVAVNGFDADYSDNDADALFERAQYFFMLLQPAITDNPEDILAKQEQCKENALQIQAKMMQDSRKYKNGLTVLITDTFTIRSIGPVGDNLYGVIMGFNIQENLEFFIKPEMWQ